MIDLVFPEMITLNIINSISEHRVACAWDVLQLK